ncbi:unnamed protein product, partial [Amoebophrya sp. A120]
VASATTKANISGPYVPGRRQYVWVSDESGQVQLSSVDGPAVPGGFVSSYEGAPHTCTGGGRKKKG